MLGELPVVLLGQEIVAGGGDEVEPQPVAPAVRGALEAAEEEGAEQAGLGSGAHVPSSKAAARAGRNFVAMEWFPLR
jgi:hypothetical protein